jgi:hypothetical protein
MIQLRQFRTPFWMAGYAITAGYVQLAGFPGFLQPNNRHIQQNHSNRLVEKSMILLSQGATRPSILVTHPSHPSFPRKVTCIKDGSFFCALPAILAGLFWVREVSG